MGGSILPITIHNGKIYFLFGKERPTDENPGWGDFGGGTDHDETFKDTAIREGGEELTGFLGTSADIKKMLNKYGTFNVDFHPEDPKYRTYRVHIFPMEYDPLLVKYYNNNENFLTSRLNFNSKELKNIRIFEKRQIKWFSMNELKTKRGQFRSFYRNIVDLILDRQREISAFVRQKLKQPSKVKVKTIRKKCNNCKCKCDCHKKHSKTVRNKK